MDVSAIMTTDPVTIDVDATLDAALQLMDDQDVRHLPVLDQGHLAGILSDRDLLEAIGWQPARTPEQIEARRSRGRPVHLRDVMQSTITVVSPDDTVVTAAVELVLLGIGCLPVVQNDELIGIVTEMDVLLAFWRNATELDGDADPAVSERMAHHPTTVDRTMSLEHAVTLSRSIHCRHLPVTEGDELIGIVSDRDLRAARGSGRLSELVVEDVMTSECVAVGPETRLSSATEIMMDQRFSALPVVEGNQRLVGIVTTTDLLDHCMNTLREPDVFRTH